MRRYLTVKNLIPAVLMLLMAATLLIGRVVHTQAAGPVIQGERAGSVDRALISNDAAAPLGSKVQRIVYFPAGVKTMVGANTPVASSAHCGLGAYTLYSAQVVLTGTMAGTNPTLSILWQHSLDGGTNWINVGSWTTINATVTPASQIQTVSDIYNASTAAAYGDCWRATYTMSGTGTVTANISVAGIAK